MCVGASSPIELAKTSPLFRTPHYGFRKSFYFFVLGSVVNCLIFRPAVHFKVFHFRLLAPVQWCFHNYRSNNRIMRIVRIRVRPLLNRRQLFHQTNNAISFRTRHIQLLRILQLERAKSKTFVSRVLYFIVIFCLRMHILIL